MKQLGYALAHRIHNSTSLTLLLLGVIEQATLHSVGCEAFLGWWPREDENIPPGTSDGYNQLLKLLLENQRPDVASLATYILHRTRFYEVACRYEVHSAFWNCACRHYAVEVHIYIYKHACV